MNVLQTLVAATSMVAGGLNVMALPYPGGGRRVSTRSHKPIFLNRTQMWICANDCCKLRATTIEEFNALCDAENANQRVILRCPARSVADIAKVKAQASQ